VTSVVTSLDRLASIVGERWLREAEPADAVAGVVPRLVVTPGDEAEVAALLRVASDAALAVTVRGGGTKLDWGAPPRRCDVVLSTRRLVRLVEHAAGDMVCVVQAGMPLETLQAQLAAAPGNRQRLMLDPPQGVAATIGGIVSCNAAGSRRVRYGTPRDLLIGARFVLGDGTVGHSGGKVVKNVAGYDVGRVLCGALGTLAVLTEAAFRLHPVPPGWRIVVLEDAPPARLAEAVEKLRRLGSAAAGIDVTWPQGLLVVRLEGSEAAVGAQAGEVAARSGGRVLDRIEAEMLGEQLRHRPWESAGAVAGIGVPRARLGALLEVCSDFAVDTVVRAGVGAAEARLPLTVDGPTVAAFRTAIAGIGGHLVLRRGGGALPAQVWPDGDPVAAWLAASLKRSLDPTGTLSPGREQAAPAASSA